MRSPLIVGIGGTTRAGSGTERILRACLDSARVLGARTRLFSGAAIDLPMYAYGPRDSRARTLTETLERADGVIIASPAYHGTVSGYVKNALDHVEDLRDAERPYLEGRAVGCIAVAGGPQAGVSTLLGLRTIVHALRGWPTPLGIAIDTSDPVFDGAGAVDDAVVLGRLDLLAEQVVDFSRGIAATAAVDDRMDRRSLRRRAHAAAPRPVPLPRALLTRSQLAGGVAPRPPSPRTSGRGSIRGSN